MGDISRAFVSSADFVGQKSEIHQYHSRRQIVAKSKRIFSNGFDVFACGYRLGDI